MKNIVRYCFFVIIGSLVSVNTSAQTNTGIGYQAVVRDGFGTLANLQNIDVLVTVLQNSATGPIVYQELHGTVTSEVGLVELTIGSGSATGSGLYTSLDSINWGGDQHYLNVQIDLGSTGTFADMGTMQFLAVPYAYHANSTDQKFNLSDLEDVDTSGISVGHTLVWDGLNWISATIDTVSYAANSGHSTYSDTSNWANSSGSVIADSAHFAFYSDTAQYSSASTNSIYADSALHADTADFAINTGIGWNLTGNSLVGGEYLGTTDPNDLIIKTDGVERVRITSDGKVGINTASPVADLELFGQNGFLAQGNLGVGTSRSFTGDRLTWYPRKAHFYCGGGTITANDSWIGDYSFGAGYNLTISGDYATAFGNASQATGNSSFSVGYDSKARGDYSFAQGNNSASNGENAIAMGRQSRAGGYCSIALGYHPEASGDHAVAIGYYTYATDTGSFAIGKSAESIHKGSFVFGDGSASALVSSTGPNQFVARAAGGVWFYSANLLTTGVNLASGSGSWSSVSDSNKKENIRVVDYQDILNKLQMIDIHEWNYKTQPASVRHIGPFAQDFYSLFGYGESDTTITNIDADGINMAALKALQTKSDLLDSKLSNYQELKKKYDLLIKERNDILRRLDTLEKEYSTEKSAKL